MYKIAYFTTDWNIDITRETIGGAVDYVMSRDDLRLHIFNCFGTPADTAKSLGEFKIYDLPDLHDYDAVFCHGNEVINRRVQTELGRRIDASGLPALSYEIPVGSGALLKTDNYSAMYEMTGHVIQTHHARRLAFVRGLEGFDEASERERGFRAACRDAGIPDEDLIFYDSNYLYQVSFVNTNRLLDSDVPVPDAFICVNDLSAMGAAQAIQNHGLLIPDDVIVTGFDNCFEATAYQPQITSVDRDYRWAAGAALQFLRRRIDGQPAIMPRSRYRLICAGSCGCTGKIQLNRSILHKYAMSNQFIKDFYHRQGTILGELFEARSLSDVMQIIERNASDLFDTQDYFLSLNRGLIDNGHRSDTFDETMAVMACGRRDLLPDEHHVYLEHSRHEPVPDAMAGDRKCFNFYPIHYGLDVLGYIVFMSPSRILTLRLMESTLSSIASAIQNVLSRMELEQANRQLEYLFHHDQLTGLYNRFGMRAVGEPLYDTLTAQGGAGARILFIDMDGMKKINDQLGHDIGDEAICQLTSILREVCAEDPECFIMRFGGDEFIIVRPDTGDDLAGRIQEAVQCDNESGASRPYLLSVSIGEVNVAPGTQKSLQDVINQADEIMYAHKKAKKAGRS